MTPSPVKRGNVSFAHQSSTAHKILSATHLDTEVLPDGIEPEDGAVLTWSAAKHAWTAEVAAVIPDGGFVGGLLELTGVWL